MIPDNDESLKQIMPHEKGMKPIVSFKSFGDMDCELDLIRFKNNAPHMESIRVGEKTKSRTTTQRDRRSYSKGKNAAFSQDTMFDSNYDTSNPNLSPRVRSGEWDGTRLSQKIPVSEITSETATTAALMGDELRGHEAEELEQVHAFLRTFGSEDGHDRLDFLTEKPTPFNLATNEPLRQVESIREGLFDKRQNRPEARSLFEEKQLNSDKLGPGNVPIHTETSQQTVNISQKPFLIFKIEELGFNIYQEHNLLRKFDEINQNDRNWSIFQALDLIGEQILPHLGVENEDKTRELLRQNLFWRNPRLTENLIASILHSRKAIVTYLEVVDDLLHPPLYRNIDQLRYAQRNALSVVQNFWENSCLERMKKAGLDYQRRLASVLSAREVAAIETVRLGESLPCIFEPGEHAKLLAIMRRTPTRYKVAAGNSLLLVFLRKHVPSLYNQIRAGERLIMKNRVLACLNDRLLAHDLIEKSPKLKAIMNSLDNTPDRVKFHHVKILKPFKLEWEP